MGCKNGISADRVLDSLPIGVWVGNVNNDVTGKITHQLGLKPKASIHVYRRLLTLQHRGSVELNVRVTRNQNTRRPSIITGVKRLI